MKSIFTSVCFLMFGIVAFAQKSDFIVLKSKKDKTLKTYYPGSFLNAETYDGFHLTGVIKEVRNDSIILQQRETRLVGTEFGTRLDTMVYTIGFSYKLIKKFNYEYNYIGSRKRGWSQVSIPKLMVIGGLGFMGLELVNTAYRKEALNSGNKLESLGIAAAVAGTGILWEHLKNRRNKVGGKYKPVYIKAGSLENNSK